MVTICSARVFTTLSNSVMVCTVTTNSSTSVANTSIQRWYLGVGVGPDQIDGDVGAAIAGRGDAPEDQDAEQELAEIVVVGDRDREELAHEHGGEDVERDDADEERRDPFDRVDEAIHDVLARRPRRAGDRCPQRVTSGMAVMKPSGWRRRLSSKAIIPECCTIVAAGSRGRSCGAIDSARERSSRRV